MRKRTKPWRTYLTVSDEITINLSDLRLIGSPPPLDVPDAWTGRQCAFIDSDRTVSIGEIIVLHDSKLQVRLNAAAARTQTLLVRDARSEKNGLLVSAAPFASGNSCHHPMPCPTRRVITVADHDRQSNYAACTQP